LMIKDRPGAHAPVRQFLVENLNYRRHAALAGLPGDVIDWVYHD
jgi:hypothetical protein